MHDTGRTIDSCAVYRRCKSFDGLLVKHGQVRRSFSILSLFRLPPCPYRSGPKKAPGSPCVSPAVSASGGLVGTSCTC